MRSPARPARVALAAAVVVTAAAGVVVTRTPSASANTGTLYGSPGQYLYTVPPGVHRLDVELGGASGGAAVRRTGGYAPPGGPGARVAASIPVAPGEVLTVRVGGAPEYGVDGGWPGGGSGGDDAGGGGGASDISRGSAFLVVAGGGGGHGGDAVSGGKGGSGGTGDVAAGNGGHAVDYGPTCPRGLGGMSGALGGAGGAGVPDPHVPARVVRTPVGGNGTPGQGGHGGVSLLGTPGGGGGGGGFVGGGGGGAGTAGNVSLCLGTSDGRVTGGGGGGGGSSYFGDGVVGEFLGVGHGDGYVAVTPLADGGDPPPAPTVPPVPEPTALPTPDVTVPPTPQPTVPPLLSGTAYPSEDCAAGLTVTDGFAGTTYLRVRTQAAGPATTWVCVRAGGPSLSFGGKFVVTAPPPGVPGPPSSDASLDACATAPGNAVPGRHPIESGAVGDPADPSTYLPFLVDAYATTGEAWVCVGVGPARHRVLVRVPGAPAPPAVSFLPDAPAPSAPDPAVPGAPSAACQAGGGEAGRLLNTTAGPARVWLYRWSPALSVARLCVRVEGVAAAGGVLTLDTSATSGALPGVTTSGDTSPCTLSVVRLDNAGVEVRRDAANRSLCVIGAGTRLRATLSGGSGQQPADASWTPDPGTPG